MPCMLDWLIINHVQQCCGRGPVLAEPAHGLGPINIVNSTTNVTFRASTNLPIAFPTQLDIMCPECHIGLMLARFFTNVTFRAGSVGAVQNVVVRPPRPAKPD